MRRALAWISGAAGAAALVRTLTRRRPPSPALAERPDPRADELRAKLAESREIASEREEFEGGETPVDEAEPLPEPAARRREVHDRGRAAVDEMRGSKDG